MSIQEINSSKEPGLQPLVITLWLPALPSKRSLITLIEVIAVGALVYMHKSWVILFQSGFQMGLQKGIQKGFQEGIQEALSTSNISPFCLDYLEGVYKV